MEWFILWIPQPTCHWFWINVLRYSTNRWNRTEDKDVTNFACTTVGSYTLSILQKFAFRLCHSQLGFLYLLWKIQDRTFSEVCGVNSPLKDVSCAAFLLHQRKSRWCQNHSWKQKIRISNILSSLKQSGSKIGAPDTSKLQLHCVPLYLWRKKIGNFVTRLGWSYKEFWIFLFCISSFQHLFDVTCFSQVEGLGARVECFFFYPGHPLTNCFDMTTLYGVEVRDGQSMDVTLSQCTDHTIWNYFFMCSKCSGLKLTFCTQSMKSWGVG